MRILIATALVYGAQASAQAIDVPETLKPAANEVLAMVVSAEGVQIYECRGGSWMFVAPKASLFDQNGKLVGTHYAGPRWEAADGSRVVGTVQSRADAPKADAIPWLLLSAKSDGPSGAFSRVTSIQRVHTTGGVGPSGDCAEPGDRARVAYTADYYLFKTK
jgi:hypothetical protein